MPYVGGGSLQGVGILEDRTSPFQLGGLAGVTDPAVSEAIRGIESITGIAAGTTYSNGVFAGGDPTVFGMSGSASLDEVRATASAISGIANRDPSAIIAGLGSSNAFLRKIAMAAIVANFDNGMGSVGQGYAIYASQPAYQSAIKSAWMAANGGGSAASDAWFRLVDQPAQQARINELFRKSNFGMGSPFRVEQNRYVRDLRTDKIVGDLNDAAFSIDALVASVRDRELAIVKQESTPEDAAQSIANTAASSPAPTVPSTGRQNAPTFIPAGSDTPGAMPTSFPTNVPAVTPTEVSKGIQEATDQASNIPGVETIGPVNAGGATGSGPYVQPIVETATPVDGTRPVSIAPAGELTPEQKKMLGVGAAALALVFFMRKGK